MSKLFLNILLIIAACLPLILLAADMLQRYPLDGALMDISLLDAALLIAALSLPLCLLSRLGVDWRARPEEY